MPDLDVKTIIEEAKEDIGDFCRYECDSKCCRNTSFEVDEDQAELVTQGEPWLVKSDSDGTLVYNFVSCKSLDECGDCKIYDNPKKPRACHDYPLYQDSLFNQTLMMSTDCEAFKAGLFEKPIQVLKKLGFNIVEYSTRKR